MDLLSSIQAKIATLYCESVMRLNAAQTDVNRYGSDLASLPILAQPGGARLLRAAGEAKVWQSVKESTADMKELENLRDQVIVGIIGTTRPSSYAPDELVEYLAGHIYGTQEVLNQIMPLFPIGTE